ncbi:MAG TPA: putative manganese-dependent inorganic diphosphatase [Opitutaceae bacterium]|jgi:manganese-dependent inorganic pyrophosphatase|nr:putative manganese-dependent inorganic diphosphatase [Opitutaceae bacterium]
MTPTYIIGHKNPDADSICSAIAYAAYKEARGESHYVAARCGNSNARIDTILARFRQPLPLYLSDVAPRVRDLMRTDVAALPESGTCADALNLIDREEVRLLPVVNQNRRVTGTIAAHQLGAFFIPRPSEPRLMRQVHASVADIVRALSGQPLNLVEPERREQVYFRVGSMDIRSFWTVSQRENVPAGQSIIIVGDRTDVQLKAIEIGVRGIIVTAGLPVEPAVVAQARAKGVNLISSPYDSATTAWVVRTAHTIERVIDRNVATTHPDVRIAEIRRKIGALPGPGYVVVDDDGVLCGILTKGDVLKPVPTRLVLVDHNEMTQAVPGAEEVTIAEIIDHHRLGPMTTSQPILFLNEPVGSTCTIIADLFRREKLAPSPEVAGLMMSGLISDTLHLNSPTSTPKDAEILLWLASIAGVNSKQLAEAIFSSGSIILAQPPDKVLRSDHKIYAEEGVRFSVSQVEELGFSNFWQKKIDLARSLEELREGEKLSFAALLVTDINTQNSLLLVKGDPEVIRRISFAHVEVDEIFDLPGIVSRKKQLIPYFASLLKEMAAG